MSAYLELKRECYEANLLLPEKKLIDLTFGNASVFDPALGVFAIKPSGVAYTEMSPDDLVVLDLEGKTVEGKLKPSSDTPTHRRIFLAYPSQVRSVVHTHSRNATSFAQAGREIPCLGTTHADYFYGEVPVTRAMTSREIEGAYEWETGCVIVERMSELELDPSRMPAMLVRGHGAFTWGPTGRKAVESAFALEIVAEMTLKAIQLNPDVQPLPRALLDRHFLRKHGAKSYYGQAPSQRPEAQA